jgi:hypothetical protein
MKSIKVIKVNQKSSQRDFLRILHYSRAFFSCIVMTHLRDFLRHETLSPLSNNFYVVLVTVIYLKLGMEIAYWIRWRSGKRRASRIVGHLCLFSVVMFWPLYDLSDWSWRLNVIVPLSVACRFLYKVRHVERRQNNQTIFPARLLCRIGNFFYRIG